MLLTQAREAATRILALASEGDHVALTSLSSLRTDSGTLAYDQPGAARNALERLQPSQISVPLGRSFAGLTKLLQSSRDANREIYILTDGQASQLAGENDEADSTAPFGSDVRLFLIRIPAGPQQNAGIVHAGVASRIIVRNRPVQIAASIRNFGTSPLHQALVSVYLDGTRVVQQSMDIAGQTTSSLTVSIVPKRAGILKGYLQLEDDALEADNTRSFVITIPERITLAAAGPASDDQRFPVLALTLGGDSLSAARVSITRILPDQLPFSDLSGSDVLLLYGMNAVSPAQGTTIANYVRRGGGLVVFPGRDLDARTFNDFLWKPLDIPPWNPTADSAQKDPTSFISFASVDYSHPVFYGLFEGQQLQKRSGPVVESPRIRRTSGMNGHDRGQAIITLGNGEAFLSEYRAGEGRVLIFAVESGTVWSDFPLKGIFVPLLHRSVAYLASPGETDTSVIVGSPIRFALHQGRIEPGGFRVTSPSGVEERVAPRSRAGGSMIEFASSPTVETGVYFLMADDADHSNSKVLAARAAVLPESEGDLRPASDDELTTFWKRYGIPESDVRNLIADSALERTVQESRFGVELWKYLLGLAVVLASAEMLIGHEGKQANT